VKLRDNPCERCGWKFPGFHVCVDLSTPEPATKATHPDMTPSQLESLNQARLSRWERHRLATADRDKKIVEMYKDGKTLKEISEEIELAYPSVNKIVTRAAERGEVRKRKRWERRTAGVTV
jgi:DNA-binding CsgD family transcriptional regulator